MSTSSDPRNQSVTDLDCQSDSEYTRGLDQMEIWFNNEENKNKLNRHKLYLIIACVVFIVLGSIIGVSVAVGNGSSTDQNIVDNKEQNHGHLPPIYPPEDKPSLSPESAAGGATSNPQQRLLVPTGNPQYRSLAPNQPSTSFPSDESSNSPDTQLPSISPSGNLQSGAPSDNPSDNLRSQSPFGNPSNVPDTQLPSGRPQTGFPSDYPSNRPQTGFPSDYPSKRPETGFPSDYPSNSPQTGFPSDYPSNRPQAPFPSDYPSREVIKSKASFPNKNSQNQCITMWDCDHCIKEKQYVVVSDCDEGRITFWWNYDPQTKQIKNVYYDDSCFSVNEINSYLVINHQPCSSNDDSQKWVISGDTVRSTKYNGKCIEVTNKDWTRSQLELKDCDNSIDQRWNFGMY